MQPIGSGTVIKALKIVALCAALIVFVGAPHAGAADSVVEYEAKGDWAAALGAHLAVLAKDAQDANARKGAWRAAMRLGLFEQAAALGAALDERERAAMEGDQIALAIRHGRIDVRTLPGPNRYRRLDAALARTDDLAAALLEHGAIDAEGARRLVDRISALSARNRPADAVQLYEALQASGHDVPVWALNDTAGAYLALRKPRTAEALYRKVLADSPDDFDANLGLFYALVESEQHDLAATHIDGFAARVSPRRHRDNLPNAERWSAEAASDRARIYAERLAEADQRIAQRLDTMPFNAEARGAEASLHIARGWRREGEADLRRNLARDPLNAALHADHAETLLALQRWEPARAELALAESLDVDNAAVRRATETFGLHDRRELYIDGGYGQGQATNPYGSRDFHIDAWLYSGPLAERWRVFLHHYNAYADFHGSATRWIRNGAGAEWRAGNWRATAEANAGEGEKVGTLGSLQWQPNDYWKLYGTAESVTNDIPLQAVRARLTAQRASLGADLRANESRKLALAATATDFSDGNRRRSASASWFERWMSGPRWTFESTLGADASENSLGYSAVYFNPPRDRSVWLGGAFEYLTRRDYNQAFRQRLTFSLGNYWQSGFGNGSMKAIEYQHKWELGRDLWLRYGIGRSLRPYDGAQEPRNFATLTVLWRF